MTEINGFQLGHVFSDMEIGISSQAWLQCDCGVSIGPRLFRHGNEGLSDEAWIECVRNIQRAIWFQLGHVFSDMEIAAYFGRLLLLTE
jgi:hypothetical protein